MADDETKIGLHQYIFQMVNACFKVKKKKIYEKKSHLT